MKAGFQFGSRLLFSPFMTIIRYHSWFLPPRFSGFAIHLHGQYGLHGRGKPFGVEGGHIFFPPSTSICHTNTSGPSDTRRWIAEPKVKRNSHAGGFKSESHLIVAIRQDADARLVPASGRTIRFSLSGIPVTGHRAAGSNSAGRPSCKTTVAAAVF